MEIKPFKIKVTPEESKIVQETLFANGIKWYRHAGVIKLKYQYIYCDGANISNGTSSKTFIAILYPELTFQQFKELYIDPKPKIIIDFNPKTENVWFDEFTHLSKKQWKHIDSELNNTKKMANLDRHIGRNNIEQRNSLDEINVLLSSIDSLQGEMLLKSKPDKSLKKIVKRLDKLIGIMENKQKCADPTFLPFIKLSDEITDECNKFATEIKNHQAANLPKAETKLPKTWEELGDINGYFAVANSNIARAVEHNSTKYNHNKNIFATEKQAKSALAYAQLTQLMKAYNGDWQPDFNEGNNPKYVIQRSGDNLTNSFAFEYFEFLSFQSEIIRDEFLKNFEDLIKQFYQMD
jgi:hypothetical protein